MRWRRGFPAHSPDWDGLGDAVLGTPQMATRPSVTYDTRPGAGPERAFPIRLACNRRLLLHSRSAVLASLPPPRRSGPRPTDAASPGKFSPNGLPLPPLLP